MSSSSLWGLGLGPIEAVGIGTGILLHQCIQRHFQLQKERKINKHIIFILPSLMWNWDMFFLWSQPANISHVWFTHFVIWFCPYICLYVCLCSKNRNTAKYHLCSGQPTQPCGPLPAPSPPAPLWCSPRPLLGRKIHKRVTLKSLIEHKTTANTGFSGCIHPFLFNTYLLH